MIGTFEELFEKLGADRKCRTVPEDKVKKVRRVGDSTREAEEADSVLWTGCWDTFSALWMWAIFGKMKRNHSLIFCWI